MKIHIPTWLTDTLKDFRKEIIRFLIVSGGLGAIILAYVTGIGTHLFALISTHIVIIAVLILFALFYFLGRRNEKSKTLKKTRKNEISIVQQELFQYGPLKWDMTIYSNGHFEVAPYPFCALHDMRLVEQWPLYFCPRFGNDCNSKIAHNEIPIARAQVESYIESELRKRRAQQ